MSFFAFSQILMALAAIIAIWIAGAGLGVRTPDMPITPPPDIATQADRASGGRMGLSSSPPAQALASKVERLNIRHAVIHVPR